MGGGALCYTRLYMNVLYKNIKTEICQKCKNMLLRYFYWWHSLCTVYASVEKSKRIAYLGIDPLIDILISKFDNLKMLSKFFVL